MERFIRSVFRTFTVWVLTAMVNGLFIAVWSLFAERFTEEFLAVGFFAFLFSLVFSLPGMFVFWLVFIVKYNEINLFQLLLRTMLIVSSISSIIAFGYLKMADEFHSYWPAFLTVAASVTAIIMHHTAIRSIVGYNNPSTLDQLKEFNNYPA